MEKTELENLIKDEKVEKIKKEEPQVGEEVLGKPKIDDYITFLEQLRRGEFGGGMTLVRTATFTNSTDITGLDGNADGFYMLLISARHSSSFYIEMRFNGDAGTNYHWLKHINSRQVNSNFHILDNVSSVNVMSIGFNTQTNYLAKILIYAKSGAVRQVKSECFGWTGWMTFCDDNQTSFLWTNTTANINTINLITGAITAGEYKLYKL